MENLRLVIFNLSEDTLYGGSMIILELRIMIVGSRQCEDDSCAWVTEVCVRWRYELCFVYPGFFFLFKGGDLSAEV